MATITVSAYEIGIKPFRDKETEEDISDFAAGNDLLLFLKLFLHFFQFFLRFFFKFFSQVSRIILGPSEDNLKSCKTNALFWSLQVFLVTKKHRGTTIQRNVVGNSGDIRQKVYKLKQQVKQSKISVRLGRKHYRNILKNYY